MSEGELDGLLGEIGGACTYDNMVKMFQEKMAGDGNDSDDLIVQAFKAYDNEGKIDSKMFTHALMTWGDKMTKAEIDDIFGEFEIDEDYMIKSKDVIGLFVAVKEEEKKEEAPPPVEEAAPEEEGCQVNTSSSFYSFPLQRCYACWRRPARNRASRGTRIQYSTFHKLLYCIVLLYSQSNTQLQLY